FIVMLDHPREGARAFAIPAAAIVLYRSSLPASYPNSPWFLGWPHAAVLVAAALACALRAYVSRWLAIAAAIAFALMFPPVLDGLRFFGRDPWLSSIIEFQPMFHEASQIGTDIANLTGGAVLLPLLSRRQPTVP